LIVFYRALGAGKKNTLVTRISNMVTAAPKILGRIILSWGAWGGFFFA